MKNSSVSSPDRPLSVTTAVPGAGLVAVHPDDPGHSGIIQEIRLGPGRLQEFQLSASHRDAFADVAGEPAEFADRIPVLLPPGMCGHPADSSGRDRDVSSDQRQ